MDLQEMCDRYEKIFSKFKPDDDEGVMIAAGELKELIRLAKMAPPVWESRLQPTKLSDL